MAKIVDNYLKIFNCKVIKKLVKILSISILVLLLLLVGLIYALRFESVQTYFAHKAANYLSKELKTTVKVDRLYFKPFSSLVLNNFLILDQSKDTLVHSPNLQVKIADFSIEKNHLRISEINLTGGKFFIKTNKESTYNFDFILDYFNSGSKNSTKKDTAASFELQLEKIVLSNLHIRYKNTGVDTLINGMNYDDIEAKHFGIVLSNIDFNKHLFQAQINNLSFEEKSGFVLKKLNTFATIDENQIILDQLDILTPHSKLGDYFAMKFNKFSDLSNFVHDVKIKAHIKENELSSKDLAKFVPIPMIQKMKTVISFSGDVSGTVDNLKIRNTTLKAGNATFINGDFNLKGLPNIDETFMDLSIKSAGTKQSDLNTILGNTIGEKQLIPAVVAKFGNIGFNGSFQGYINNFIAYGDFKSQIGGAIVDVNMKFDKNNRPSYSGKIKTQQLNIGKIIAENSIGKLTSTLKIDGSGSGLEDLNVKLDGKADQFYYNAYNYQNIDINGTFKNKSFDGRIGITDKNITLNFDGGVDLRNKLPKFHFDADVKNINLHALHFMKDSLRVSAIFKTNFSGNSLGNIAGKLAIRKVEIYNTSEHYRIDSLTVNAFGVGKERYLNISSDAFEAQVKGQFDLGTIVPYYQSLAKKYIPSLNIKTQRFNPQVFQSTLLIKNFTPISRFLMKGLHIENGATIVGDFNSEKGIATLNGFIKNISYNDISVDNIILDQYTDDRQMQAVLTSDKIQLNDSAALKNLNLSYKLRNDSLSMNVKLTDELEYNRIDLNGLVEFSTDSIARLSVLPSLVYLNNEEWKIEDKADIRFGNNKIFIHNLEIGNQDQQLEVNGAISEDLKDKLNIKLSKLKLSTFNPFLKAYSVQLNGSLNGESNIFGITEKLQIQNDLYIDSLTVNDRLIGKLTDQSSYSQQDLKADINTKVNAFGQDNIKLEGAIDIANKNIDIGIILKEAELVLFTPFVKDFVSDLDGTISTEASIKGSFDNPNIKGNVHFEDAIFKLNLLGTTYLINDNLEIDNSIIRFRNLELLDVEGHVANVRGNINLSNIANPNLNIFITAKNFMALNTTARDNDLYYGKAYATTSDSNQPIHIYGKPDQLVIDVNAKAEAGTVFNLPLNSVSSVSDKDFIEYIGKDTTIKTTKKALILKGMQLNFNLQVDPYSTVNIYTILGNLSGQGNGNIYMNINTLGDFTMNGEYIIEHGNFNLIKGELINKQFEIKKGGTIQWTGNPLEAQISNLNAVYDVRTTSKELYTAANRPISGDNNNGQRIETEVNMLINGTLSKPSPILSISFPNNPGIKDDLQTYLSDQNNVNLQAFSLILRRSFSPNTNSNFSNQLGSSLTGIMNYGSEIFFTQASTAVNQLLNSNILDINIRSFSDANAGLKLMNGRLLLSGGIINTSIGNNSRTVSSAFFNTTNFNRNNTAVEAEISYLVRPDGGFISKLGFKPPIQQDVITSTNSTPTTFNVWSPGVVFNTQFENFSEFAQNIFGKRKKDKDSTIQIDNIDHPQTNNRRNRRYSQSSLKDRIEEFEQQLNEK